MYRSFCDGLDERWSDFLSKRAEHFAQSIRRGAALEKNTEGIIDEFLMVVLRWEQAQIEYQVGKADISLVSNHITRMIIETKRPGLLSNPKIFKKALEQAYGYAHKRRVTNVAVSDGIVFYAESTIDNVPVGRAQVSLTQRSVPDPEMLFLISPDGIYRDVHVNIRRPCPDVFPRAR